MSSEAAVPLRDVFISHASADKLLANAVCATLEQKQLRCWIAPRDIPAGATWGKVIIDAIDQCRVMVVVVSGSSNQSAYVLREVERAIHRGLPVLPLRIEDVPLSKELELFLSSTHWLDAITPPVEQHFIHLADSIKALISGQSPPPPPRPRRRLRPVLIASLLLLTGAFAVWKFWPPDLDAASYKDVPTLLKAAEGGEAEAQWLLAQRYCDGDGVTKDLGEAAKWCRRAADQGHPAAATRLGSLYFYGDGVSESRHDAEQWWLRAAEKGSPLAQLYLGKAYQNGDLPTGVNFKKAADFLRKAADQGNPEAASRLGYMYERGDGVDRDYSEAAKWYLKAAEQDEVTAQVSLGELYSEGKGVLKNTEAALRWYKRAADQNDPSAQNTLGLYYEFGDPGQPQGSHQPEYADAVRWYQRAADQDYALAQFNLGRCCENGNGLPRNLPQAALWYALAKDRFEPAREALMRVDQDLLPQEREAVSAAVKVWQPKR